MNATLEVKAPLQVMVGSFNYATGKHRRFIPAPLRFADSSATLLEAAANAACSLHGNGVELPCGVEGMTRHALLIQDHDSLCSYLPFGNWIVEYDYTDNDGTHAHKLFLALEII